MTIKNYNSIDFLNYNKFVVLDTESTGFTVKEPYPDELTEIGAVKVENNQIVDRFSMLIKPYMHTLNKGQAVNVTGITDELVKDAEGYVSVLNKFYEFCGDDYILMMHNAPHDLRFLQYWGGKMGLRFDQPYIDTLDLAKAIVDQAWLTEKEMRPKPSHKLQELAIVYNVADPSHHRAENDAEVTWYVFQKIRDSFFRQHPDFNVKSTPIEFKPESKQLDVKGDEIKIISACPWNKNGYYRLYVRYNQNNPEDPSYADVFYDFTKQCWAIKATMFPIASFDKVEAEVRRIFNCKQTQKMQFKDFEGRKYYAS